LTKPNDKKASVRILGQQNGKEKRHPVLLPPELDLQGDKGDIRKKKVIQVTEALLEGTFVIDSEKIAEAMMKKK
jgi:anti-sigma28 factor (negative regulator of flagellin synthesis)